MTDHQIASMIFFSKIYARTQSELKTDEEEARTQPYNQSHKRHAIDLLF